MRYYHHLITNFPPHTSLWRRACANIGFNVAVTLLTRRMPDLTVDDAQRVAEVAMPGDLVLAGSYRRVLGRLAGGAVTHGFICTAPDTLVHAAADGIERTSTALLHEEYDTVAVCRPRGLNQEHIERLVKYIDHRIGQPFDFFFAPGEEAFFCTELIDTAYRAAGFEFVFDNLPPRSFRSQAHRTPDYLYANVDSVYTSRTLKFFDGRYVYSKGNQ